MEPLGGLLGHLEGVLEPSWGRLEASWSSSRPPGGEGGLGRIVPDATPAVSGGSLYPSKRQSRLDPRHLRGILISERQSRGQLTEPRHTVVHSHGGGYII